MIGLKNLRYLQNLRDFFNVILHIFKFTKAFHLNKIAKVFILFLIIYYLFFLKFSLCFENDRIKNLRYLQNLRDFFNAKGAKVFFNIVLYIFKFSKAFHLNKIAKFSCLPFFILFL